MIRHRSQVEMPGEVRLFLLVSLLLNGAGILCEAVCRYVLRLGLPYNLPLLYEPPVPDLTNFIPAFEHLHSAAFFDTSYSVPYMYPAPVAPLYGFFLSLPFRKYVFESVLALLLLACAFLFGRALVRFGVSVATSRLIAGGALLLSYPALFELKQGNMEIFVCILVGVGIWCFAKDRPHAAAVCLGIAGAMKIFPFVYLGLFLARRRYWPVLTAVVSAVVVTVVSLRYLTPSLSGSWHGVASGLSYYQQTVALRVRVETGFDHSLFGMLKVLAQQHVHTTAGVTSLLHGYLALAALGGVVLFFGRIRHMPLINQVLSLGVASILLPPVSFDYTLLHLYVAWGMLVLLAFRNANRVTAGLRAAFLCLAVLTSIETELIYEGRTVEGQLKAVVLVILFWIAVRFPFVSARDVAGEEPAYRPVSA